MHTINAILTDSRPDKMLYGCYYFCFWNAFSCCGTCMTRGQSRSDTKRIEHNAAAVAPGIHINTDRISGNLTYLNILTRFEKLVQTFFSSPLLSKYIKFKT